MFFSGTLQEKLNGWKDVEKSFIRGCVICLAFKCAGKLLLCTKVLKSHAIFGKNGKNSRNTNFENKRKAWWCGRDDFGSFGLTNRSTEKKKCQNEKFFCFLALPARKYFTESYARFLTKFLRKESAVFTVPAEIKTDISLHHNRCLLAFRTFL